MKTSERQPIRVIRCEELGHPLQELPRLPEVMDPPMARVLSDDRDLAMPPEDLAETLDLSGPGIEETAAELLSVAVAQAKLVIGYFPDAEVTITADAEVLDEAAKEQAGGVEYVYGSTRTVVIELGSGVLALTRREPEPGTAQADADAQARQQQQRAEYLTMGPTASIEHAVEVRQHITATWRETRREVTDERAAGARVDRIERIAEALECCTFDRHSERAAAALSWLNDASVTVPEFYESANIAGDHLWPRGSQLLATGGDDGGSMVFVFPTAQN